MCTEGQRPGNPTASSATGACEYRVNITTKKAETSWRCYVRSPFHNHPRIFSLPFGESESLPLLGSSTSRESMLSMTSPMIGLPSDINRAAVTSNDNLAQHMGQGYAVNQHPGLHSSHLGVANGSGDLQQPTPNAHNPSGSDRDAAWEAFPPLSVINPSDHMRQIDAAVHAVNSRALTERSMRSDQTSAARPNRADLDNSRDGLTPSRHHEASSAPTFSRDNVRLNADRTPARGVQQDGSKSQATQKQAKLTESNSCRSETGRSANKVTEHLLATAAMPFRQLKEESLTLDEAPRERLLLRCHMLIDQHDN